MSDSPYPQSSVTGRKEIEDWITPIQVQRMSATLDREDPVPREGDPLPPGWHHLFFSLAGLPLTRELGPDGRNTRDWPGDPELPLRVFAGSRARFFRPLRIGDKARCVSELISVIPKQGRTGRLVIKTYRHTISNQEGVATMEEWDMVDCEAPKDGKKKLSTGQPAPTDALWEKVVYPSPVMLFRFSAVTFNPHRIHYDHPYATAKEGYPGLLLHGPLTSTLLIDLARDSNPGARMTGFEMHAKVPLFAERPVRLVGRPREGGKVCDLWAVTPENTIGMEAFATFAGSAGLRGEAA